MLLLDFEKNVPWCPILKRLMKKEALQLSENPVRLQAKSKEVLLVPPSFQLFLCTALPIEALAEGEQGEQEAGWRAGPSLFRQ